MTTNYSKKEFEWLKYEPEPNILFSDIETKNYGVLLHDVFNPEYSNFAKGRKYLVFKCTLIDGFDNSYDKTLRYQFHFPLNAFQIAWNNYSKKLDVIKGEKYDCILSFRRESKKKIVIIDRKFIQLKLNVDTTEQSV